MRIHSISVLLVFVFCSAASALPYNWPGPYGPNGEDCVFDSGIGVWTCPGETGDPQGKVSRAKAHKSKNRSVSVVCEGVHYSLPLYLRVQIAGNEYYLQNTQGPSSGRQHLGAEFLLQINRSAVSQICVRGEGNEK